MTAARLSAAMAGVQFVFSAGATGAFPDEDPWEPRRLLRSREGRTLVFTSAPSTTALRFRST